MNLNFVHDFQECLEMSHQADELPFWEEVYRKAFPNMAAMINHRQDGWHQRAGIDRSVVLDNSNRILIDEKVRGRNKKTGAVYKDIALEYISNDRSGAPGWVCKSLAADYIAYAIAPFGWCFLLPVVQLQSAWEKNQQEWMKKYPCKPAPNKGYQTWFCAVPVNILFKAIGQELRIYFEPYEYEE